jgi:hypothetical protein
VPLGDAAYLPITTDRLIGQDAAMTWWPDDQWQRMWSGEDCAMCRDASQPSNPFSDLIMETD